MAASSNQWYVEMSAGITLGPMPFDALVELAESSAIMRDDRVREESSEAWQAAHEVSGLFGKVTDEPALSNETTRSIEETLSDEPAGTKVVSLSRYEVTEETPSGDAQLPATTDEPTNSAEQAVASDGVVRLDGFEVLLGESETSGQSEEDPANALLNAAAKLETADPELAPSASNSKVSSRPPIQHAGSETPSNSGPTDREPPKLEMPAPPALAEPSSPMVETPPVATPPSHQATADEHSANSSDGGADIDKSGIDEVNPPPDLAALVSAGIEEESVPLRPVPSAAPPRVQTPVQPWQPPDNQNRRFIIGGALAGLAVVSVWSLFSLLMPDLEAATYDQYAAIYQEYQSLKESPDAGNWTEFSTRSMAELDESLPGLEAAAVPGERSKSLLLYAGRDLRSALELSPETTNPHAERLAGFFEQLNQLHASRQ